MASTHASSSVAVVNRDVNNLQIVPWNQGGETVKPLGEFDPSIFQIKELGVNDKEPFLGKRPSVGVAFGSTEACADKHDDRTSGRNSRKSRVPARFCGGATIPTTTSEGGPKMKRATSRLPPKRGSGSGSAADCNKRGLSGTGFFEVPILRYDEGAEDLEVNLTTPFSSLEATLKRGIKIQKLNVENDPCESESNTSNGGRSSRKMTVKNTSGKKDPKGSQTSPNARKANNGSIRSSNATYQPPAVNEAQQLQCADSRGGGGRGGGDDVKSPQPTFTLTMKYSNVIKSFWLSVPVDFCSRYLPRSDKMLTLQNCQGETWQVKFLAEKHGFSGGWRRFSLDNHLKIGDFLVYQLICPLTFLVRITSLGESKAAVQSGETAKETVKKRGRPPSAGGKSSSLALFSFWKKRSSNDSKGGSLGPKPHLDSTSSDIQQEENSAVKEDAVTKNLAKIAGPNLSAENSPGQKLQQKSPVSVMCPKEVSFKQHSDSSSAQTGGSIGNINKATGGPEIVALFVDLFHKGLEFSDDNDRDEARQAFDKIVRDGRQYVNKFCGETTNAVRSPQHRRQCCNVVMDENIIPGQNGGVLAGAEPQNKRRKNKNSTAEPQGVNTAAENGSDFLQQYASCRTFLHAAVELINARERENNLSRANHADNPGGSGGPNTRSKRRSTASTVISESGGRGKGEGNGNDLGAVPVESGLSQFVALYGMEKGRKLGVLP